MKIILLVILFLLTFPHHAAASEVEIYFNASVEKYLQGDYSNAINNLEKALDFEPENNSIKKFLLKIFVEAATQYSLEHKYSEAMSYLKKAKKRFPDDRKIDELYRVTKGILSQYEPAKYKISTVEPEITKTPVNKEKSELKELTKELEVLKQKAKKKQIKSGNIKKPKKVYRTKVSKPQRKKVITNKPLVQNPEKKVKKATTYLLYMAFSYILIVILVVYTIRLKRTLRKQQIHLEKKVSDLVKNLNNLQTEKGKLTYELVLEKERHKLEKIFNEKMDRELERAKTQLDYSIHRNPVLAPRTKKIDLPRIKNETEGMFIKKQKEEMKSLSTDTNILKEETFNAQPVIEQTRERIAAMAQNIYEQSSKTALEFIKEMAENSDSRMRSNIVRALTKIGKPETLEILFKLNNDPDERVKREVVKSLKTLHEQTANNKISLIDEHRIKIDELIKNEYENAEWVF